MHIPTHLDIGNPHSFEMKDLEHLIKKVSHNNCYVFRNERFRTLDKEGKS